MKKIILLFLFSLSTLSAQEKKASAKLEWDAIIRLSLLKTVAFGDNALAKAHHPESGLDINWSLFRYDKFRAGIGYDFAYFSVSDKSMIGNIDHSNYTSFYGFISYDWRVAKKILLYPNIGYGGAKLQQKGSDSDLYGHQTGDEIRLGVIGTYEITPGTSIVLSAHYLHTFLEVKTNPEFESYFGTANQIQIGIGFQFK